MTGFIRLTLWNFEAEHWHASHVRTSDIVRIAAASEAAKRHIEGACSEIAAASGGALVSKESPEEIMERIAAAERGPR